jgi:hypothetical protein
VSSSDDPEASCRPLHLFPATAWANQAARAISSSTSWAISSMVFSVGCSPCATMYTSRLSSESDSGGDWWIGSVAGGQPISWWSALSSKGSYSASPSMLDPCPSCASFTRLIRTGASGTRPVPDPAISNDSSSCRLRSLNLSAMKRRDARTLLELGRNLVVDWNVTDLT